MNPYAEQVLQVKSGLAIAFAVFAFLALILGFAVYLYKRADNQGSLLVKTPLFSMTAAGAGAVIMATAIAWGWLSAAVSPNLAASRDNVTIYSFSTSKGSVQAPVVATTGAGKTISWTAPASQAEVFKQLSQVYGSGFSIFYKPARVEGVNVTTTNGKTLLSALLKSSDATAVVQYEPNIQPIANGKQRLVFRPLSATVTRAE